MMRHAAPAPPSDVQGTLCSAKAEALGIAAHQQGKEDERTLQTW